MSSMTSVLPPDLLSRIFWYLSAEEQQISKCRLVSREFSKLSSPYLLNTIVYANRVNAIVRFQEILDHPYFHKHITQLLYDGSAYSRHLTESFEDYCAVCSEAPRDLRHCEWIDGVHEDNVVLLRVCAGFFKPGNGTPSQVCEIDDVDGVRTDVTDQLLTNSLSDALTEGYHISLADYRRHWHAQELIDHNHLPRGLLRRAFRGLPKLRKIVLTDWRGLARGTESYDECANRLFGNTLSPETIPNDISAEWALHEISHAFADSKGTSIESFAIGSHHFEVGTCEDNREPQYVCAYELLNTALPLMLPMAKTLRSLRLQFNVTSHSIPLDSLFFGQLEHMEDLIISIETLRLDDQFVPVSQGVLQALRLPRLRRLDLRRWCMLRSDLQGVLLSAASTLRELRLLDCCIECCPASGPFELAEWIGKTLHLHGLEFLDDGGEDSRITPRPSIANQPGLGRRALLRQHEPLCLQGRPNRIIREQDKLPIEDTEEAPWYTQPHRAREL